MKELKISFGRCISTYKRTPGPSFKEYDFWQQVLGAHEMYSPKYGHDEAADSMRQCSAGHAWSRYMMQVYKGTPWGLVSEAREKWAAADKTPEWEERMSRVKKLKIELAFGSSAVMTNADVKELLEKVALEIEEHDPADTAKHRIQNYNGTSVGYYRIYKGETPTL